MTSPFACLDHFHSIILENAHDQVIAVYRIDTLIAGDKIK